MPLGIFNNDPFLYLSIQFCLTLSFLSETYRIDPLVVHCLLIVPALATFFEHPQQTQTQNLS